MTVEFSLLFVISALVVLAPVVMQLRGIGRRIAALRQELESAPITRELRYTVREVIVRREGNVVVLPVRQARSLPQPLRAAA